MAADVLPAAPAPAPLPALAAEAVDALRSALEASMAPATRRAYSLAWDRFARFAAEHGSEAIPAAPELVAAYLGKRRAEGASMATLNMARAAVAKCHEASGLANPCSAAVVRQALAGMARQMAAEGRTQRQAKALGVEQVAAIRGHLNGEAHRSPFAATTMALCSVLSSAGLRRSEASALTWADVDADARTVAIRRSKTDQIGEGAVVALSGDAADDLAKLRAMLPDEHAADDAHVFSLSPSQVSRRVAKAAKDAGLGDGYSGHSGRVGMAVRMTKAGAPAAVTMRQGRWASASMVARYTRKLAASEAQRYL